VTFDSIGPTADAERLYQRAVRERPAAWFGEVEILLPELRSELLAFAGLMPGVVADANARRRLERLLRRRQLLRSSASDSTADMWRTTAWLYFRTEEVKLRRHFSWYQRALNRLGEVPPNHPLWLKVWKATLIGRLKATAGNYHGAHETYMQVIDRVGGRPPFKAASERRRAYLLQGMLYHDAANAEAMFGDLQQALLHAQQSEDAYKAYRAEGGDERRARVGIIRSYVVRQQAYCYRGEFDRTVEFGEEVARLQQPRGGRRGPPYLDVYSQAKSEHFMALAHLYVGRYQSAMHHADESNKLAGKIPRGPMEWDWAMWIRDGGPFARGWWRAIASGAKGDVYAAAWLALGERRYWTEADAAYKENHEVVTRTLGRGARAMISAQGLHRWLVHEPTSDPRRDFADAYDGISHDLELAYYTDFPMYIVIALLCRAWLARPMESRQASVDMDLRLAAQWADPARRGHKQLAKLVRAATPFPMPAGWRPQASTDISASQRPSLRPSAPGWGGSAGAAGSSQR